MRSLGVVCLLAAWCALVEPLAAQITTDESMFGYMQDEHDAPPWVRPCEIPRSRSGGRDTERPAVRELFRDPFSTGALGVLMCLVWLGFAKNHIKVEIKVSPRE